MNLWDVLILLAVGGAVLLAVRSVRKKKTGCSCGCGGCTLDCPSRKK